MDALRALALRLAGRLPEDRPDLLLLLGDQIYADAVSPATMAFIRGRRDVSLPPGEQAPDFQEYTRLYHEAWSEPAVRWLLSTVPTTASPVYQAVCSPYRNELEGWLRAAWLARGLARLAGVEPDAATCRILHGPCFDNQVGMLELEGRAAAAHRGRCRRRRRPPAPAAAAAGIRAGRRGGMTLPQAAAVVDLEVTSGGRTTPGRSGRRTYRRRP